MRLDLISVGASLIDLVALVNRFPDSDDEIYIPDLRIEYGGSAANTAVACSRLGLKVAFLGKIGLDYFGDLILKKFMEEKVDTSLILRTPETPTGLCFIAVDSTGDRRMFAYSGAANKLSVSELNISKLLETRLLYMASLENTGFLAELSKKVREQGLKTALNPGALIANQGLLKAKPIIENTDIYISSYSEAVKILRVEGLDEIKENLFKLGVSTIAITLGSKGCMVANQRETYMIPAIKVAVKDTTGAGDAFTAGFLTGLLNDRSLVEAGFMGVCAAALKIQHIGARGGLPSREELEKFMKKYNKNYLT
ncbi:MAG: carbohydrate kinase family protein [Candidatus Odinarchaeum yellowstonii]|uniref:Carbohydrate kinase family protein n=1 Tax=Odinarchaeota yellowstonii (strain LCB_4) TaxID=1841599 RepID=A0AAF0D290_ODILC|nr:MAG: carbohydrate kinase family protein [Candidatus Odinarchaeum yellowstonii]